MQANEITLYELEERLNLQVATDRNIDKIIDILLSFISTES